MAILPSTGRSSTATGPLFFRSLLHARERASNASSTSSTVFQIGSLSMMPPYQGRRGPFRAANAILPRLYSRGHHG